MFASLPSTLVSSDILTVMWLMLLLTGGFSFLFSDQCSVVPVVYIFTALIIKW